MPATVLTFISPEPAVVSGNVAWEFYVKLYSQQCNCVDSRICVTVSIVYCNKWLQDVCPWTLQRTWLTASEHKKTDQLQILFFASLP